jgi:hypothetical protein
MSDYPKRASGEFAGTFCSVKKCTRYARFTITAMNPVLKGGALPIGCCAHHVSVVSKGVMAMQESAAVIQEVPGNWLSNGSELAAVDGELVQLRMNDRR